MHKGSAIKKFLAIHVTSASSHVHFDGLFDFIIFIIIIITTVIITFCHNHCYYYQYRYYYYHLIIILIIIIITIIIILYSLFAIIPKNIYKDYDKFLKNRKIH